MSTGLAHDTQGLRRPSGAGPAGRMMLSSRWCIEPLVYQGRAPGLCSGNGPSGPVDVARGDT